MKDLGNIQFMECKFKVFKSVKKLSRGQLPPTILNLLRIGLELPFYMYDELFLYISSNFYPYDTCGISLSEYSVGLFTYMTL